MSAPAAASLPIGRSSPRARPAHGVRRELCRVLLVLPHRSRLFRPPHGGPERHRVVGADAGNEHALDGRFSRGISGCPIYWEVDKYLRERGFELYDLDVYRLSKKALPYPYLYANYFDDGRPAAGPSTQGQVFEANALYMRDLVAASADPRRLIVAACLFEIFGLADCAAELILAHRDPFDALVPSDRLLDLLVPEVKGRSLTCRQYMDRDLVGDSLLRPTDGRRFPEAVITQYDGEFAASWENKRVVKDTFWKRLFARFG